MRAHIVFAALQTQNRFALCHLAFKSIRKLHKPSTRIQDTTNDVLQRIAGIEERQVGAADVIALESNQEQPSIALPAEVPSAEPIEPLAATEDTGIETVFSSR
jgi:hypothetical protein